MDIRNCILACVTPLSLLAQNVNAEERPNIILIMADDLGWGDVGFNGNRVIKTPHLDALANDGLILNRFYSACAVSSPTRSSVLTGRNPHRTGIFSANVGILREEELTLPEIVQEVGYTTGHFGKWHLGTLTDKETDANRGRKGETALLNPPAEHGYDDSFVTESKVPTYDPMVKPKENNGRFWDYIKEGDETSSYNTFYWNHDGSKVIDNLSGDNSRVIMDRVIPFIEKAKVNDTPFFSVVWFHTPHLPCVAGPEYAKMYEDYTLEERNYYGCITAMDDQIGRLIEYLKDNNLYDNTLIYFCSDNGPEIGTPGITGGLKSRKRSLYEGGIRVPAFAVWPDKIKGGIKTEIPCFTSDYLPTIVNILSLEPSLYQIDGESIYPILKGKNRRNKPLVFCYSGQGVVMDGKYKLYYSKKGYELYNIETDRGEKHNILDQEPKIAEKLKNVLKQHMSDYEKSFNGMEYKTGFTAKIKQTWESIW